MNTRGRWNLSILLFVFVPATIMFAALIQSMVAAIGLMFVIHSMCGLWFWLMCRHNSVRHPFKLFLILVFGWSASLVFAGTDSLNRIVDNITIGKEG